MKKVAMYFLTLFFTYQLSAQQTVEQFDHGIRLNYVAKTTGYRGDNVTVGIEDNANVDMDNVHLRNRVIITDNNYDDIGGTHATDVANKAMSRSNKKPNMDRAAGKVDILSNYKRVDLAAHYQNEDLRVVNRSLGKNDPVGHYTDRAANRDLDILSHDNFMYFFSSGNNRKKGVIKNYGLYGNTGNITLTNYDTTFATLTGDVKHCKNAIVVNSYNPNDLPTDDGSCGPAYDGRIKPEVTATGKATSFSSPQVAATYAVLVQAYKEEHGGTEPYSAYLKALILNSADDIGPPGPDFRTGFGRVNARRSYAAMLDDQAAFQSVNDNELVDVEFAGNTDLTIPNYPAGVTQYADLKIMVYWHDTNSAAYHLPDDNAFKALVNDIHMKASVQRGSNTQIFDPLVLDHITNLRNPAVEGIDTLNNVEQIVIKNPQPGDIVNIKLFGNDISAVGGQQCVVVYDLVPKELVLTHPVAGIGGEKFNQNDKEYIRWDANGYDEHDNFIIEYKLLGTTNWIDTDTIENKVYALPKYYKHEQDRHVLWTVPNSIPDFSVIKIRVRSTDDNYNFIDESTSDWLTVANDVKDLQVTWKDGSDPTNRKAGISWTANPDADYYKIYRMGISDEFIQFTNNTTTATTAIIENLQVGQESLQAGTGNWNEWISIAPVKNGIEAKRCTAVEMPRGDTYIAYADAVGATHVTTTSAVLNARVLPRQDVIVHGMQFQLAEDVGGTLNFQDVGNVFTNNGQSYNANRLEYLDWNSFDPELNSDKDYYYRLKTDVEYNNKDFTEYSEATIVQVPAGSAAKLMENAYFTMAPIPEYDADPTLTVEFWARASAIDKTNLISIGEINNGNNRDVLALSISNDNGRLRWELNDGANHYFNLDKPLTDMHHFAIVYNELFDKLCLFLDGALVGNSIVTGAGLAFTNAKIKIGGKYNGYIDELRFWSTARTEKEIREFMHYGIPSIALPGEPSNYPAELLRYIQFDEESLNPLESISLNQLNVNKEPNFIPSAFPISEPYQGQDTIFNFGWNHFKDQSTWMITQNGFTPDGNMLVSRLHTKPVNGPKTNGNNINNLPLGFTITEVFDRDYRIADSYCSDDPATDYRLKIMLPLENGHAESPANIWLLHRPANSAGDWNFVTAANQINYNVVPNTYHIFFNDQTEFGQFIAVRGAINGSSFVQSNEHLDVLEDKNRAIKIYPNPMHHGHSIFVELDDSENGPGELQLQIFDVLGRVVLQQRLAEAKAEVGLGGLAAGIYVCEILGGAGIVHAQKLVISE